MPSFIWFRTCVHFKGKTRKKILLLLSRFSRVRLCTTPQTAAYQAPRPWGSQGKNTGVGCHFLLQCMKVKSESEVAQLCLTLSDPMDCGLLGSSVPGIFQAGVLEWGATARRFYSPNNAVEHLSLFPVFLPHAFPGGWWRGGGGDLPALLFCLQ